MRFLEAYFKLKLVMKYCHPEGVTSHVMDCTNKYFILGVLIGMHDNSRLLFTTT